MSLTTAQHFDSVALQLVKPQIDASLLQIQTALNAFVDESSNQVGLAEAAEGLTQIHGILRLLEITGGIELAKANELLLSRILQQASTVVDNEQISALSEGLMMLSRYLEFAVLRENLLPHFLLPSINRIYSVLDLPLLREGYFLQPYLAVIQLPRLDFAVQQPDISPQQTVQLMLLFKACLNHVLQKHPTALDYQGLKLVSHFSSMLASSQPSALYWHAVDAALTDMEQCHLSDARLRTLIQIERHLQKFIGNPAGFQPSTEDMADVLTFSTCRDHPQSDALRQQLGLDDYLPSDAQSEMLSRYLFGPDSHTMHVTTALMQQEITEIKNKIDIMQHGDRIDGGFAALAQHLNELAQGLSLLNLEEASTLLAYQANTLGQWTHLNNYEDVNNLMDALLYAGNALTVLSRSYQTGANNLPFHNLHIALHQIEEAREVLIRESRETISLTIRALNGYMESSDVLHMANVPAMFESVAGALTFLEAPDGSQMLHQAARYVTDHVAPHHPAPSGRVIALLADVVASVDYYLENLELHQPPGVQPFAIGCRSAQQLQAA